MTRLHAFEGFGLELEFIIVDRQTLSVLPIADRFLDDINHATAPECSPALAWSNELALHAVEIKNPQPVANLAGLRAGLQNEIRRANRVLAAHNAMLMPGAMHPWMNPRHEARLWPHIHHEIYEAYHRIFNCHDHGWANVQSVQINLPFADDAEFERLHAACRIVAPLIPALAAASPIVEGQFTGFSDYRMHAYATHQQRLLESIGAVIPDVVRSQEDYEARVQAPMFRALDALDPDGTLRAEWLDVRAIVPRFSRNAIEIRAIDAQECPKADLAVSNAVAAAVHWLYHTDAPSLTQQQALPTAVLTRIFQACVKEGAHTLLMDEAYLNLLRLPTTGLEAGAAWRTLIQRAREAGHEFDEATDTALAVMLNQGTLARRILRAINHDYSHARLETVWRSLCRCLHEDDLCCLPQRQ